MEWLGLRLVGGRRKNKDLWTASPGHKISFTSRPLGIKVLLDSTRDLALYDYENQQATFVIYNPTIKNKKGKTIHYSIAIVMKTAEGND
jgi:hypothetical protein